MPSTTLPAPVPAAPRPVRLKVLLRFLRPAWRRAALGIREWEFIPPGSPRGKPYRKVVCGVRFDGASGAVCHRGRPVFGITVVRVTDEGHVRLPPFAVHYVRTLAIEFVNGDELFTLECGSRRPPQV